MILVSSSPNLDLCSNKHFAFTFSFGAQKLKRRALGQILSRKLSISFELNFKAGSVLRTHFPFFVRCIFFLSCDKQRKGRFFCSEVLSFYLWSMISPENPLGSCDLMDLNWSAQSPLIHILCPILQKKKKEGKRKRKKKVCP